MDNRCLNDRAGQIDSLIFPITADREASPWDSPLITSSFLNLTTHNPNLRKISFTRAALTEFLQFLKFFL